MKKTITKGILLLFAIYYCLPLIGTFLYASSTSWNKSILPDDFTFRWYQELVTDPTFLLAVGRSLLLAISVLTIVLVIMVPTIIGLELFYPKVSNQLQKMVLFPYAVPGVVMVTALLRTYSKIGIPMFFVLVGALFVTTLPIVYLGITNQMRMMDLKNLVEAATTLGASFPTIIRKILLPNLRIGTTLVSLMIFSSVFGEFMFTNLLIGGRFETLRIYMLRNMNKNGHLGSAVMVIYLIMMILIALGTFALSNRQKKVLSQAENAPVTSKKGLRLKKKVVTENVFNN